MCAAGKRPAPQVPPTFGSPEGAQQSNQPGGDGAGGLSSQALAPVTQAATQVTKKKRKDTELEQLNGFLANEVPRFFPAVFNNGAMLDKVGGGKEA